MKRITSVVSLLLLLLSSRMLYAVGLNPLWLQMQLNNPDFNAAKMDFVATQQGSNQARAALLPALTAGVGSSWTDQQLSDRGRQEVGSNGYALTLRMPLVDIPAWKQLDIAHLQEMAATYSWQAQQRELMMKLAQAWFALQNAQAQQRVAQRRLAILQTDLQRTQARFQAGEVTVVDVDEVHASCDLAASDVAEADAIRTQAQDTLRQFTGGEMQTVPGLPDNLTLPSASIHSIDEWQKLARLHNDNSAVAGINKEIAARLLGKVKAEWLPRVDMVASWNHSNHSDSDYQYAHGFTSVDGVTTAQGAGNSAVIGVQLTMPLYNGGETLSHEREAAALAEQARYQWQSQQNRTEMQTRQHYNALITGEKRIQALQLAQVSSAKAAASIQLGYSLGDRVNADRLSAQYRQDEIRNRLQQESSRYLINWLGLLQLTGQLDSQTLTAIDARINAARGGSFEQQQDTIRPLSIRFETLPGAGQIE